MTTRRTATRPPATENTPRHFAVVPAAGSGTRLGADRPKQYLDLHGATVLERQTYTGPGVRRLKLSDGRRYPFFADGPVPSDHCPVLARVRFS